MDEAKTITVGNTTYDFRDDSKVPLSGMGINILDNWYFANPDAVVDQRGGWIVPVGITIYSDAALKTVAVQTSTDVLPVTYVNTTYGIFHNTASDRDYYVKYGDMVRGYTGAVYGIDRWKAGDHSITVSVESDYIRVRIGRAANNCWFLRQFRETIQGLSGKVTISALVRKGRADMAFELRNYTIPTSYAHTAETTAWQLITNTVDAAGDSGNIGFVSNQALVDGDYVDIKAVKFELGDTQTLAHQDSAGNWVLNEIPNYAAELAKCQRYQLVLNQEKATYEYCGIGIAASSTGAYILVPLPVTMRAIPTCSFSGIFAVNNGLRASTGIAVTQMNSSGFSSASRTSFAVIRCTVESGLVTGTPYILHAGSGTSKIILDANL